MVSFTIEPYIGAIPLRFGMSPADVKVILGPPDELIPHPLGSRSELRKYLSLGYDSTGSSLIEVVFSPGCNVSYRGQDLFLTTDLIAFLQQFDPNPKSWVGFVIFLDLGISLSGFHDGDESQKAIAIVKKGYWDEYIEDFESFER